MRINPSEKPPASTGLSRGIRNCMLLALAVWLIIWAILGWIGAIVSGQQPGSAACIREPLWELHCRQPAGAQAPLPEVR